MSSIPTPSAPPAEIETFKRRKIAIIPFIFSVIILILIWTTQPLYRYNENINDGLFFSCLSILTLIHLFYTFTLLLAPRYLYRGVAWIKAAPWIISGFGLLTMYFYMNPSSVFLYIVCIFGFLLQVTQFIACVLPKETEISFIFKPFEKRMIPNLLAKIDLTNPNARLDTIYGPPLTIPSSITGQCPAIVRYGSQAVKIQQPQPVQQQTAPYFQPSAPASSVSVSNAEELPPAYAPPVYQQSTTNYSEKSSFTHEKSRCDVKK